MYRLVICIISAFFAFDNPYLAYKDEDKRQGKAAQARFTVTAQVVKGINAYKAQDHKSIRLDQISRDKLDRLHETQIVFDCNSNERFLVFK